MELAHKKKITNEVKNSPVVRKIREQLAEGKTQAQVAEEMGVSQPRISQVISGTASKGTNKVQVKLSSGTSPSDAAQRA